MDFQRYQTVSLSHQSINLANPFAQPYNLVLVNDMQLWLSNVLTEKGSTSIDALYRRSRECPFRH